MTSTAAFPGPRGHWLLGSLPRLRADMLGFFEECFRDYGDAVYFRPGNRRSMLLSHPDDVERVLVTENRRFIKNYALQFLKPLLGNGLLINEGDSWLRQRRLIQPAFARPRVESYAGAMVASTQRMLNQWQNDETRDIVPAMMRLTMEIAGKTLLGIELGDEFNKIARLLESTMYDFLGRFSAAIPLPFWVPTPRNLRLRLTVWQLDRILQSLIDRRRAQGAGGGDFLSLLLNAKDEQDGRGISDRQIRDEVMTMFLAGHETTAVALCWTWLLLAQHPEIQDRVAIEAVAVLGDREPTAADVPKLVFCEQVIRESMRLYPPAYVVGRRPIEDITIGRHFIPAGTNVLMSQWIVQRDPRWYDAPLRFHPDRWADGLASRLPKYAYFPFGGGPRLCIGNTFALFEAPLILAMIARRFRLSLATSSEIRIQPAVTLRPRDPIPMRIQRR
ncbi:MAG TPA: cytochrome P450 [Pirellulaceae bacterium]|jgi:cytochrome P450